MTPDTPTITRDLVERLRQSQALGVEGLEAKLQARAAANAIEEQAEEIERLQKKIRNALGLLEASLFTNAEHSQAKYVLCAALQESKT